MPPKIKTTKENIVIAAFEVARCEGLMAITAQSVSKELGTSVAPIFRVFNTVEELRSAATAYANDYHIKYLQSYETQYSSFLTYGLAYISFAKKEPFLFEMLMKGGYYNLSNVKKMITQQLSFVVSSAAKVANINEEVAGTIFYHVWIYTHGVASVLSHSDTPFIESEIAGCLQVAFRSLLEHYQLENK